MSAQPSTRRSQILISALLAISCSEGGGCAGPPAILVGSEYLTDTLEDTPTTRYVGVDLAGSAAELANATEPYWDRDKSDQVRQTARYEPDLIRKIHVSSSNHVDVFAFAVDFAIWSKDLTTIELLNGDERLDFVSIDTPDFPSLDAIDNTLRKLILTQAALLREYRIEALQDAAFKKKVRDAIGAGKCVRFTPITMPNGTFRIPLLVPVNKVAPASANTPTVLKVQFRGHWGGTDGAPAFIKLVRDSVFDIGVIGDSIAWGQGVPEPLKWYTLLAQTIVEQTGRAVRVHRFAHSGARVTPATVDPMSQALVMERDTKTACVKPQPYVNGEIPTANPAVLCQAFMIDDPEETPDLDMVFLTGCADDLGIEPIMSEDSAHSSHMRELSEQACHNGLFNLVKLIINENLEVRGKIVPTVVLGYPQLFSSATRQNLEQFIRSAASDTLDTIHKVEFTALLSGFLIYTLSGVELGATVGPEGVLPGAIIGAGVGIMMAKIEYDQVNVNIMDMANKIANALQSNGAMIRHDQELAVDSFGAGFAPLVFPGDGQLSSQFQAARRNNRAYFGNEWPMWLWSGDRTRQGEVVTAAIHSVIQSTIDDIGDLFRAGRPKFSRISSGVNIVPWLRTPLTYQVVSQITNDLVASERYCTCSLGASTGQTTFEASKDLNLCFLGGLIHPNLQGNRAQAISALLGLTRAAPILDTARRQLLQSLLDRFDNTGASMLGYRRPIPAQFIRPVHHGQCYSSLTDGERVSLACVHRRINVPLPRDVEGATRTVSVGPFGVYESGVGYQYPTATVTNYSSPNRDAINLDPYYYGCVNAEYWTSDLPMPPDYVDRFPDVLPRPYSGTDIWARWASHEFVPAKYPADQMSEFGSGVIDGIMVVPVKAMACVEDEVHRYLDRPKEPCDNGALYCGVVAESEMGCVIDGQCSLDKYCDTPAQPGRVGSLSLSCQPCDPLTMVCPVVAPGVCGCRNDLDCMSPAAAGPNPSRRCDLANGICIQ